MTANDLVAIEARLQSTSSGPWDALTREGEYALVGRLEDRGTGKCVAVFGTPMPNHVADAQFTAAARDDVPALVAEVRELRARISQAADALADDRRDPETQDRIAYDILTEGSELADATEPGYMGAYPGTPGEFAARWNAWDQERRAEWLRARVRSAETASLCVMQDHAGALYQATEVLPNALRNERIAGRAVALSQAEIGRLRRLLKRRMHGREFRRKVQGGRR